MKYTVKHKERTNQIIVTDSKGNRQAYGIKSITLGYAYNQPEINQYPAHIHSEIWSLISKHYL